MAANPKVHDENRAARMIVIEAAKAALEKAGNVASNAAIFLAEDANRSPALRDALFIDWLPKICAAEIHRLTDAARAKMVFGRRDPARETGEGYAHRTDSRPLEASSAAPAAMSDVDRVVTLARGNQQALLSFPLPGGKPLSDATREEIQEGAKFYYRQSRTMHLRGRWLSLIATEVPDGKTAGMAMTEKRLGELRQRAEINDA